MLRMQSMILFFTNLNLNYLFIYTSFIPQNRGKIILNLKKSRKLITIYVYHNNACR